MLRAYAVHCYSARASGRQKGLKIRFYKFCQKETVIRKARELNEIIFQGNKIQIYHRISVSTLEKRQEEKKKKQILKDGEVYFCGFPIMHFFVYYGQSHNMRDLKDREIAEGKF